MNTETTRRQAIRRRPGALRVPLFEAEGPGSCLEVPFDVPEDGDYEVYTQLAQGSDYGTYTVLLDGKPPTAPQLEHEPGADVRPQTRIDGYAVETYVGADYQVGWPRLAKGRHTLSYVCLGRNAASSGYNLGVDNIVLARTGAVAWAAAAAVREPMHPSGSVADLARALSDTDPVTRGLAAIELRARGAAARPALEALTTALRDPDANVRLMSGNAIAAIGPAAAPAVPGLVAACSVPDEQVHVLRACATALGAIGPAAVPALPILREIAKQPRVQWAAEAAIRSIGGGE